MHRDGLLLGRKGVAEVDDSPGHVLEGQVCQVEGRDMSPGQGAPWGTMGEQGQHARGEEAGFGNYQRWNQLLQSVEILFRRIEKPAPHPEAISWRRIDASSGAGSGLQEALTFCKLVREKLDPQCLQALGT